MNKFSDFAVNEHILEGIKISIDDLLDKPITIIQYRLKKSKFKPETNCLTLQINLCNEIRVIFTGSQVLIDLCERYRDYLPFETKIIKIKKYYTFA